MLAPLLLRPDLARVYARNSGAQEGRIGSGAMLADMRILGMALGALIVLAGLVWIAQGLNLPFAPASFMTGDRTWIVLGAVAVLVGAGLVGWARGRK